MSRKPIQPVYKRLGKRVRGLLKGNGMTHAELAKKLGWPRCSVTHTCNARDRILLHDVEALAKALNVTPATLMHGVWRCV